MALWKIGSDVARINLFYNILLSKVPPKKRLHRYESSPIITSYQYFGDDDPPSSLTVA